MASLTETLTGLKNKNTDTTASAQQRYPVQFISYTCLEGSSYNFYPMTEIDDLADAIELAGRILQPLLVRRKAPGRYEIIAGHRRWTAAKKLVEQGRTQYAMIPCHVQDGDEMIARINLIVTNSQREKTAFVKMKEVVELEQLLQELANGSEDERKKFSRITGLKLDNGETVTARVLRKLVAKKAGLSETNVARLKHIDQNLEPELKEALEEGKIGISVADELARLKPEDQQEAAKKLEAGEKILVQSARGKESIADKSTPNEVESVSESDTPRQNKTINRRTTSAQEPEEKSFEAMGANEEQLPGQINMDEYISDQQEEPDEEILKTTEMEEIDAKKILDKPEESTTVEVLNVHESVMKSKSDNLKPKEISDHDMAEQYMMLYERSDASTEDWEEMHRQLANYFQKRLEA